MRKVLVTGGAGFIGSHLVEKLVEHSNEVTVIDNLVSGKLVNLENVKDKIKFYKASVLEHKTVNRLTEEAAVVFHLATHCLVKGLEDPRQMHEVNDVGTFNVCMAAKEHDAKIVFVSTSEVYGLQSTFPLREIATLIPMSIYGQTKAAAEQYVKFFHRIYGVEAVIIRPFNTFGPRQREDGYAGVITSFIKRVESGAPPMIYGDGRQTRDFTYISDTVDGILSLSKLHDGEIVNIGSGKETEIEELAHKVFEAMGEKPQLPFYHAPRINDLRHLQADITKAKKYGFNPKIDLDEGLKKYVQWWRNK